MRTIRQTVVLPGTPTDVYEALMTTRGHAGFTGAKARISPKVGGTFVAWDGYIHGRNLRLVRGKRIEQSWVPSEPTWPDGHASTIRILLRPTARGTRLSFTQTGVPAEHAGHLGRGWKESYWTPLRKYLTRRAATVRRRPTKLARRPRRPPQRRR